jgi:peptide-methionine (R)-S-oxide reductase
MNSRKEEMLKEAMADAKKTDAEWKATLTPEEYRVLREKGTEPRGGEYDAFYPAPKDGYFVCKACRAPLYSAESKFRSGCGWPAFDKCYKGSVTTTVDSTHGMQRVEITCKACGGHLGHVFAGERMTPSNERHCVNSVSVAFVKGEPPALAEEGVAVAPNQTERWV